MANHTAASLAAGGTPVFDFIDLTLHACGAPVYVHVLPGAANGLIRNMALAMTTVATGIVNRLDLSLGLLIHKMRAFSVIEDLDAVAVCVLDALSAVAPLSNVRAVVHVKDPAN